MELPLNPEDVLVLRQVVEAKLAELTVEIRHTDTRTYREELKRRRDVLRRIDDALVQLGEEKT
ncbi:MAG TPA: hypothetical protein VKP64_04225, partial [Mycobacteriales bacterium]|nr:hypothetical protein [Mycobacteriales bacterium]